MYKSAILGCRGRARGHARAYEHVKGGKLAAICDMQEDVLNDFGDEFRIDARYTDLDEMLSKEKPDLLHIVTAPVLRGSNKRIRYPLMNQASEHGVPAVIVEKPVAVESEDWGRYPSLPNALKRSSLSTHNSISIRRILPSNVMLQKVKSVQSNLLRQARATHPLTKLRMSYNSCRPILTTRDPRRYKDRSLVPNNSILRNLRPPTPQHS